MKIPFFKPISIFLLLMSFPLAITAQSWTQLGSDIDGETVGDESGRSVSLSSDGKRVAIGAINNNGGGTSSGHARVFSEAGGVWTQVGSDIDAENSQDFFGWSISLASDGTRVAIGAVLNDGAGSNAGHVRVFSETGGVWTQVGSDIDGEAEGDESGSSVSLSSDGTRVAIGARYNDGTGTNAGHVRIYSETGGVWTQVGSDIDGEAEGDGSDTSVSLSSDGSRVAIGAPTRDNGRGHVRVFSETGGVWTQVGSEISGEAEGDASGTSVSLSSDGSRVAIGARSNITEAGDYYAGHVRLYSETGGVWTQLGPDIDGESPEDNSGTSVSLSSDGTRVAIGAPYNDGGGDQSGHTRIYTGVYSSEMRIKQASTIIEDNGGYDFGITTAGNFTDILFTIENLGEAELIIETPIALIGIDAEQFSIQSQPVNPISIGGTTTFTVRFSPTEGKSYVAAISIANNDIDENPYNLNIYGTGISNLINIPADYNTIQLGLNNASTGDTVLVQPGTYTENLFWPETNGIKLISAGDSSNTIIDGGGGSVVYINPSTVTIDTTTLIKGFKIANGDNVTYGGGVFIKNADVKLEEVNIQNNQCTYDGGGIYGYNSSFILKNSIIQNNIAQHYGGGIHSEGGTPNISKTDIINNTANDHGGGIELYSSAVITDCTIDGNNSNYGGGASTCGSPIFKNVVFINNTADRGGGIQINCGAGETELDDVIIISNTANIGGGLYFSGNSLKTKNVTIADNHSSGNGGGAYLYNDPGSLDGINVCYNSADVEGGGIFVYQYVDVQIAHSNIFSNISNNSGSGITISNSDVIVNNANIFRNGTGLINKTNFYVTDAENNYWGDPTGPYHPAQNTTGLGDSTNMFVDITPWLTEPDTSAPPIPAHNVVMSVLSNGHIQLSWDASPIGDLSGYQIYWDDDEPGYPYSNSIDVGNVTSYNLSDLTYGTDNYVAVTCYDDDGNESWYSQEATIVGRCMNGGIIYNTATGKFNFCEDGVWVEK